MVQKVISTSTKHTILFILVLYHRRSSFTAWTVDLAVLQSLVNNVTIIITDWKKIPPNQHHKNMYSQMSTQLFKKIL